MSSSRLRKLLRDYREGKIDESDLVSWLVDLPYQDLDFARVDHHRELRHGFPEVIFGTGKTVPQVVEITEAILSRSSPLLITRGSETILKELSTRHADVVFHERSRAITVGRFPSPEGPGRIGIISAGTADLPVAEEADITARITGNHTLCIHDAGVAGVHRVFPHLDELRGCRVLIVVAGMEGALPSLVGGLVPRPVIAVPTSIGYGASLGGVAALLGMLNSCASNVSVVNIDNGFGAGYIAAMINRDSGTEDP